ncbi:MAG: phosphoadenosine phosphosulfate reductase family protein, partial [Bacteroidota bacterium]
MKWLDLSNYDLELKATWDRKLNFFKFFISNPEGFTVNSKIRKMLTGNGYFKESYWNTFTSPATKKVTRFLSNLPEAKIIDIDPEKVGWIKPDNIKNYNENVAFKIDNIKDVDIHNYFPKENSFELPGNKDKDIYLVATSGGADSTSMCVLLKKLFPNQKFLFCFTDTGAEDKELYDNLQVLEHYLGQEILRIKSERGTFFDLLDAQGNFLPAGNARWCTRILKFLPFQNFMDSLHMENPDSNIYNFVGIRADEPARTGFETKDGYLHTIFPFRELGMEREHVFKLLADSIGVPGFYKYRSRSGCSICPFMRRTELLGLYRWSPESYEKSASYEKLSDFDMGRFKDTSTSLWEELGWGKNWTGMPFPKEIDIRGGEDIEVHSLRSKVEKKLKEKGIEIELPEVETGEKKSIWFGGEFHVDGLMGIFSGNSSGITWQEPVSFSSSKGGLSRQLNMLCSHRLQTPETYFMDEEEMKESLKFASYQIGIPSKLIDINSPTKLEKGNPDSSYTWNSQFSMYQLKQVYNWWLRTLHVNNLYQQYLEYADLPESMTWESEHRDIILKAISKIKEPVGELVSMQIFTP